MYDIHDLQRILTSLTSTNNRASANVTALTQIKTFIQQNPDVIPSLLVVNNMEQFLKDTQKFPEDVAKLLKEIRHLIF
jgi:hypothetical protein